MRSYAPAHNPGLGEGLVTEKSFSVVAGWTPILGLGGVKSCSIVGVSVTWAPDWTVSTTITLFPLYLFLGWVEREQKGASL